MKMMTVLALGFVGGNWEVTIIYVGNLFDLLVELSSLFLSMSNCLLVYVVGCGGYMCRCIFHAVLYALSKISDCVCNIRYGIKVAI